MTKEDKTLLRQYGFDVDREEPLEILWPNEDEDGEIVSVDRATGYCAELILNVVKANHHIATARQAIEDLEDHLQPLIPINADEVFRGFSRG